MQRCRARFAAVQQHVPTDHACLSDNVAQKIAFVHVPRCASAVAKDVMGLQKQGGLGEKPGVYRLLVSREARPTRWPKLIRYFLIEGEKGRKQVDDFVACS